jgi:hypothetical protein
MDRRLGGPQSQFGQLGEKKIIDPTRAQTPTPWSSSPYPITRPTALFIFRTKKWAENRRIRMNIGGRSTGVRALT